MSTEIREWINEIWEYCQEHWMVVAAGAAVVLILLVSFILVLAAKRDDNEEVDVPETSDLPEDTDVPPAEPDRTQEASDDAPAEPNLIPEPETASETALETPAGVPAGCAQGVVEQLMKSVEAASGASGQKVESIELKIEKARLTIRYAGAPEEEEQAEEMLQAECGCGGEILQAEDFAEKVEAETEAAEEKESVQPKKFGVENMNRARSGRVFTEEELLNQIRD